jgi:outer membrane protein assembly factor BamB
MRSIPLSGCHVPRAIWIGLAMLPILTATALVSPAAEQTPAVAAPVKAGAAAGKSVQDTAWASFRNGPAQLGVATSGLPKNLELVWKFPTVDGIVTAPAIVGDHAYIPALSGKLFCRELRTGRLVWSYRSIDSADPDEFAPGFKATPTVTPDTIYLGDEDGMFHAVSRETGKKKWTFQTGAEIAGGAALYGDRVIFGSHDSSLYCLEADDGALVWKFQTDDRVNCSPAIVGHHTFVAGCDEHLRIIDVRDGTQKGDIPLGSYLIASPAVIGNMLYVGTYASEVQAIDWREQKIVWRYKDPKREFPYHGSAAVTDRYVVVGGRDKQMHCIERATGKGVWKFPTGGQIDSSPVIVGDRVFFGSLDRNIYGLRLSDGEQLWKYNAAARVSAAPAVGEGYLLIGAEGGKGHIFCFGGKE